MALADSLSIWWIVGWGVGFGGAVVAALLLLLVIQTGRKIVGQAREIQDAIDSAHRNTEPMFDLPRTNLALDKLVHRLRGDDGGHPR